MVKEITAMLDRGLLYHSQATWELDCTSRLMTAGDRNN